MSDVRSPTGGRSAPRDTLDEVRDVARDLRSLEERTKSRLDAGAESFAQMRASVSGAAAEAKAAHVAASSAEARVAAVERDVEELKPAKAGRTPATLHLLWLASLAGIALSWLAAGRQFIGRDEVERGDTLLEARVERCDERNRELHVRLVELGTRFDMHLKAEADAAAKASSARKR